MFQLEATYTTALAKRKVKMESVNPENGEARPFKKPKDDVPAPNEAELRTAIANEQVKHTWFNNHSRNLAGQVQGYRVESVLEAKGHIDYRNEKIGTGERCTGILPNTDTSTWKLNESRHDVNKNDNVMYKANKKRQKNMP